MRIQETNEIVNDAKSRWAHPRSTRNRSMLSNLLKMAVFRRAPKLAVGWMVFSAVAAGVSMLMKRRQKQSFLGMH